MGENYSSFHEILNTIGEKLYIFGYGSLIWKPNFPYSQRMIGYIKGYKRRFYQSSITHRGTPKNPGRIVTLLLSKNKDDRVWGAAFEVVGKENIRKTIDLLVVRETVQANYRFEKMPFYTKLDVDKKADPFPNIVEVFVCVAEPGNRDYAGKAPLEEQVMQIVRAIGDAGPNVEYLAKLVDFIHTEVPEEDQKFDQHTLDLWNFVHNYLKKPEDNNNLE
ncbi:unnamed protein product [Hymenolepis diminuta]|uniref:glutathione-specific gamma-glutamylcyclotransferase n=1 Tax=Hymenolepis diminuta TaxID=6216 RepID=A0A0R3SXP7_HYMDI|nr:unnamed protein product [Hymenolepis diminuta]